MDLRTLLTAVCCCLLPVLTLRGQAAGAHVQVRVKDNRDMPLEAAQVILQSGEEVLGFSFTDREGLCRIGLPEHPREDLRLTIRSLGYQTRELPLNGAPPSAGTLNAVLHPTSIELREVTVKDRIPPLIERQDTLLYDADSYRDGTERHVEDLLRKLPGVEVEEDGKISVLGKEIEKVLIEGDDVFGANYRIGTQNISANLIDRVEVIDRFSDDPVLKDLVSSDKTVLNLHLQEGKRQFAFGEVHALAGPRGASDNQVNIFALRKKTKAFLIGSQNTVGAPALSLLDVAYLTGDQPGLADRDLMSQGLLNEPLPRQSGALDRKRWNDNKTGQGALVFLTHPHEKVRIRSLLYAMSDRNRLSSVEDTRFYLTADTLEINTFDDWQRSGRPLHAESGIDWQINERSRLRANWQWQNDRPSTNSRQLSRTILGEDPLLAEFGSRSSRQIASLSYAYRLTEHLALSAQAEGIVKDEQQKIDYLGRRYADASALDQPIALLQQNARQYIRAFRMRTSALFQQGPWNGAIHLGYRSHRSENNSVLGYAPEANAPLQDLGADYINGTAYALEEGALSAQLNREFHRWKVQVSMDLIRAVLRLQHAGPTTIADQRLWLFLPGITLEQRLSRRSVLSAGWQFQQQPAAAENLLPGFILQDYRTVIQGIDNPYLLNTQTLNLRYKYTNAFEQLTFYTTYDLTLLSAGEGRIIEIGPWLDRVRLYLNGGARTHVLRLQLSKFLAPLKGNISLRMQGLQVESENRIDGGTVLSRIRSLQSELTYRTSAAKFLKPYLSLGYALQHISNAGQTEHVNLAINHRVEYGGGFVLDIPKKVIFKLNAEGVYWTQRREASRALFVDATLQIPVLKENRLQLEAKALNLLDQQTFRSAGLTIYSEQVLHFPLRSRILLFGLKWTF